MKRFLKKAITAAFILVSVLNTIGCATSILWSYAKSDVKPFNISSKECYKSKKDTDSESDRKTHVYADNIYIIDPYKEKNICIPYRNKQTDEHEKQKMLMIKTDSYTYNLKILDAVFNDPINLKIISVSANAQYRLTLDGRKQKYFIIDINFLLPDDKVIFIGDEERYNIEEEKCNVKHPDDIHSDLLNAVIRKRWNEKFGDDKEVPSFKPFAWVDEEGRVIKNQLCSPDKFQQGSMNTRRLLLKVSYPSNEIKYILLPFNISKYDNFPDYNDHNRPVIIANCKDNSAWFSFGVYAGSFRYPMMPLAMPNMESLDAYNCSLPEWTPLFKNNKMYQFDLYFSESKERRVYNGPFPLPFKILFTPISIAIDAVTFPFQLLIGFTGEYWLPKAG